MKIIFNVNESGVHWCVSQQGRTSEFGTIEPGCNLALEIGSFRLLGAVVDEAEPGDAPEDGGPVGYIDPATDAQLADALEDVEM